jgi:cardiolipin synthase
MPVLHVPLRGRTNLRNHRKLVVVDGRIGMVGGMNLAREYLGPTPLEGRWRDVAMRIEGPAVFELAALFRSDWEFASKEALPPPDLDSGQPVMPGASIQVAPSGPDVPEDVLYDALLTALFEARSRIWIATPYFVPDEAIARALELAARRGVDVRIVVPWPSNHRLADVAGGSYLRQIEAAGAHVLLHRQGMMHAKVMVIDESYAILGSANLDMRSLFLNYEIGLFFHSPAEIELLAGWYQSLAGTTTEGLPKAGRARLVAEDLGRLLAPLV